MVDTTDTPLVEDALLAVDSSHPVFAGVALDAEKQVEVWDDALLGPDDSINVTGSTNVGNGTLIRRL